MIKSDYDLTDDNYIIMAAKAYDKPNCVMSEFESDMKRIKYIKRLIKRFKQHDDLKERLILNHIIILNNVFGVEFTSKMLFLKIDAEDYDVLKTFLVYLNIMPNKISTINGKDLISSNIIMNTKVIDILRKI